MDGPVAIAPEHFLSDRRDPPAHGRPGDVEVVEAMRVEHAPLAVSSPDHHRCTASATPAVDGDLVVARPVGGLQTLDGRPSASRRLTVSVCKRARARSLSPSMASRSTRRSIFEATLLTFWPPGPDDRTARMVSARPGTRTVSVTTIGSLTIRIL